MTTTLIIPAYKADWCLEDCLRSVARQTSLPNRILIGCDACADSAEKALELKAAFTKTGRGRRRLTIDVYYFPYHVGPYRIRNMLSLMAAPGALLFFDADDVMYANFVEKMTEGLTPTTFMTPKADKKRLDVPGADTSRGIAHGVIGVDRHAFILHGGFEGWLCGADTEARYRFRWGGLDQRETADVVMLVRKHAGGLTMADRTGPQSTLRRGYRQEIARRRKQPRRMEAIAIADCFEVGDMAEVEKLRAAADAGNVPGCPPAPVREITFAVKRRSGAPAAANPKDAGDRKVKRMGYAEYMHKVVGANPRRRR